MAEDRSDSATVTARPVSDFWGDPGLSNPALLPTGQGRGQICRPAYDDVMWRVLRTAGRVLWDIVRGEYDEVQLNRGEI